MRSVGAADHEQLLQTVGRLYRQILICSIADLVPAKHYWREPSAKAAMIEINRRLYMDEQTGERLPSFDQVGNAVSGMLAVVGHFPRSCEADPQKRTAIGSCDSRGLGSNAASVLAAADQS